MVVAVIARIKAKITIAHSPARNSLHKKSIDNLNLVKLNAKDNYRITDVSHMRNLRILDVSGNCGIDQKGIAGLKLTKLRSHRNNKIRRY